MRTIENENESDFECEHLEDKNTKSLIKIENSSTYQSRLLGRGSLWIQSLDNGALTSTVLLSSARVL